MNDGDNYSALRLWVVTGREGAGEVSEEEGEKWFLGTVLHKAIELLLKYGSFRDERNLTEIVDRSIKAAWAILQERVPEDWNDSEEKIKEIQQEARRILTEAMSNRNFYGLFSCADDDNVIIRPEAEIVDTKGRTFRIDLMKIRPSLKQVEVFDFKTHKMDPEKIKRQLGQYLRVVKQAFDSSWEVKGIVVYLDPPEIEVVS